MRSFAAPPSLLWMHFKYQITCHFHANENKNVHWLRQFCIVYELRLHRIHSQQQWNEFMRARKEKEKKRFAILILVVGKFRMVEALFSFIWFNNFRSIAHTSGWCSFFFFLSLATSYVKIQKKLDVRMKAVDKHGTGKNEDERKTMSGG